MKPTNVSRVNWGFLVVLSLLGISLGSILGSISDTFVSPYIAPKPDQLFQKLIGDPVGWGKAILWTFCASLLAACLSVAIGLVVGFTAAYFKLWSIDKWAQLLWSIPLIAVATYLLLAVGYGWAYGLALAVFLGFYPIEKHTFDYCASRSEGINSLAASFGLSRQSEYLHLRLAGAVRGLGTSLSQCLPLCFIGETMGEFTSAKISEFSIGLGGILRHAQNNSDYAALWLAIVLMMLLVFFSGEMVKSLWIKLFPHNEEREMFQ